MAFFTQLVAESAGAQVQVCAAPNKALQPTVIPLCGLPAAELGR